MGNERIEHNNKLWVLLNYELEQLFKPLEEERVDDEPVLE